MGGSNFDQIAQAVLQQQKLMQDLQEQNNQLRQQLHDLRCGRGIFVLINGTRFSLAEITSNHDGAPPVDAQVSTIPTTPTSSPAQEEQTITTASAETIAPADIDTPTQEETMVAPSAALSSATTSSEVGEDSTQPSFLEDLMLSEFTSAMTSPLHVQTSPSTSTTDIQSSQSSDSSDEHDETKQQDDLRRALIGSYVLD